MAGRKNEKIAELNQIAQDYLKKLEEDQKVINDLIRMKDEYLKNVAKVCNILLIA